VRQRVLVSRRERLTRAQRPRLDGVELGALVGACDRISPAGVCGAGILSIATGPDCTTPRS
jgi:hypothetical protein